MTATFSFTVPSAIPQDLQLIQDLIGEIPLVSNSKLPEAPVYSDHDHGTDSDTDSEKEVEADILGLVGEEDADGAPPSESTSDSDTSSDSDSESEKEENMGSRKMHQKRAELDLDDEEEPTATSEAQVRTKNEVIDLDIITVPEISEVDQHEYLEKVGEVMSIIDRVVIVKGIPSGIANRGSEKALDSDTLLVFEDRTVLGYIFETFGPTSEPLYQIRFNQKFPLDSEKVLIGRAVFHVPTRSNYVFVQQLRHLRGSDASNVHDEEPGEDEVEFSDDEQEAAHKRAQTQRREHSRARSVTSSRHTTPVPSRMRDQDMVDGPYGESSTAYDTSLPYNDMDFGAGPSRPAPIPYDDPYSDSYGVIPPEDRKEDETTSKPPGSPTHASRDNRGQGRARGGPSHEPPQRHSDSGRNRGRGRRQNDRGRGRGRGRGADHRPSSDSLNNWQGRSHSQRSMSPTSLAIARATGQYTGGAPTGVDMTGNEWGYAQHPVQSFDFSYQYQYPPVQPHINPRFAANFGMGSMEMSYGAYGGQSAPYSQDSSGYAVSGKGPGGWEEDWGPSSRSPSSLEDGK